MTITPLPLRGALVISHDAHADGRGSFRRVVDFDELRSHGAAGTVAQVSTAFNSVRGTLRGMHYHVSPHEESKTLWCTRGSAYDVLVDLRPSEPTYGTWCAVTLTASEPVAVHVPPGVAHGYQTLEDDTELVYLISAAHDPSAARTLLWSDPALSIPWPLPLSRISERDREAPSWPPEH